MLECSKHCANGWGNFPAKAFSSVNALLQCAVYRVLGDNAPNGTLKVPDQAGNLVGLFQHTKAQKLALRQAGFTAPIFDHLHHIDSKSAVELSRFGRFFITERYHSIPFP